MEAINTNETRIYTGVVASPRPRQNSEVFHKDGYTVVITTPAEPGTISVSCYVNSFDTYITGRSFKTRAGADKYAAKFLGGGR